MTPVTLEFWQFAATQGVFAVLFVFLLFYVMKVQERRDKRSEFREDDLISTIKEAHNTNQLQALTNQQLARAVDNIERRMNGS